MGRRIIETNELNYSAIEIKNATPYLDKLSKEKYKDGKTKLNTRQRAFAWYYCHNKYKPMDAYQRAYYSDFSRKTGEIIIKYPKKQQEVSNFNRKCAIKAQQNLTKINIQEAVKLIQENISRKIKHDTPNLLLKQLEVQATYDPAMFINMDGSPKYKNIEDIPEEYRCCIEGSESRYHGKDAQVKTIKISLVDRTKARKELKELAPHIFIPAVESKKVLHTTLDKDGKEVGVDFSKMSDNELHGILDDIDGEDTKSVKLK